MIIILEGPDGGGKTTLAKTLCERLSCEYHHEGPPPLTKSAFHHYTEQLESFRDKRIVLDRFAWGELVYGPILRGISRLNDDDWRHMKLWYADVKATELLVMPPYEVAYKNWVDRKGELFVNPSYFRRVYDTYARLNEVERVLVYDYTQTSLETLIEAIEEVNR